MRKIFLHGMYSVTDLSRLVREETSAYYAARQTNFTNPEFAKRFVQNAIGAEESEQFYVLFLDTQHRLIKAEIVFHGTIDASMVYARELVRKSIEHNAAAIIIAHNHPSGNSEPSTADRRSTQQIKQAMELIDIQLLDHLVVGSDVVSFVERGML